jgi:hypothetical protein
MAARLHHLARVISNIDLQSLWKKQMDVLKTIARAFPAACCGVSEHNKR